MPVVKEFLEEGSLRAVGISNHGCTDMQIVLDMDIPILSNQLPYNLLNRVVEDEVGICQQVGGWYYSLLKSKVLNEAILCFPIAINKP